MFAITGITGNVGGEVARTLLAAGQPVRAVMRSVAKASAWAAQGSDIVIARMDAAAQLTSAFAGAEAVFILPPSEFDPAPGYPEARAVIDAVVAALAAARPARIVCLSTIGADAPHDNLLSQRGLLEAAIGKLGVPVTFLRPAWFFENALWDLASARETGVIHSFLQPLDKLFPMVATRDVGRLAAQLLQQTWTGERIVELEGPQRISPNALAAALSAALGAPVRAEIVPREAWEGLFRGQGMAHPGPRMRMLDGFNEGWIEFRDGGAHAVKGETSLQEVIDALTTSELARR